MTYRNNFTVDAVVSDRTAILEHPPLQDVNNTYRQRAFDSFGIKGQLPDDQTAIKVGETLFDSALLTQSRDLKNGSTLSVIDFEIADLSTKIAEEMKKNHPNWSSIDDMIRMLAVYLQRKYGREEAQLAQQELDQVKIELENVLKTYKDPWSLALNVACGSISVIGGLVGLGATGTGIFQLVNGANKVSAMVTTASGISTAAGSLSSGITQALGKFLDNRVERKRTFHNFWMQRHKDNKDTAIQGASTARQSMDSTKSMNDRVNEARHQAFIAR